MNYKFAVNFVTLRYGREEVYFIDASEEKLKKISSPDLANSLECDDKLCPGDCHIEIRLIGVEKC